jgi:hypothetical protein
MENKIITRNFKRKAKKGGYVGNEMWTAHRLEGVVKNKAIKPIKKKKQIKAKAKPIDKGHNPNKFSKKPKKEENLEN